VEGEKKKKSCEKCEKFALKYQKSIIRKTRSHNEAKVVNSAVFITLWSESRTKEKLKNGIQIRFGNFPFGRNSRVEANECGSSRQKQRKFQYRSLLPPTSWPRDANWQANLYARTVHLEPRASRVRSRKVIISDRNQFFFLHSTWLCNKHLRRLESASWAFAISVSHDFVTHRELSSLLSRFIDRLDKRLMIFFRRNVHDAVYRARHHHLSSYKIYSFLIKSINSL